MPPALVLALASAVATNRFTLRDRLDLDRWGEIAQARGGVRLVVHERQDGDPSDVGNYAAVYAAGCCWASWGLSRRPGGIVVWNSVTGRDRGRFASVHEALGWVLDRHPDPECKPSYDRAESRDRAPRALRPGARLGLVEGVGFEPT
ncbi:MAG: hypothetical protein ACRYG6_08250 [Janthinobacterium lividum]